VLYSLVWAVVLHGVWYVRLVLVYWEASVQDARGDVCKGRYAEMASGEVVAELAGVVEVL